MIKLFDKMSRTRKILTDLLSKQNRDNPKKYSDELLGKGHVKNPLSYDNDIDVPIPSKLEESGKQMLNMIGVAFRAIEGEEER